MPDGMLQVEFCAPGRPVLEVRAPEIVLPGGEGVLTVMPGHTALLTTLLPGVAVLYDESGAETYYALNSGFVQIRDDRVVILTDTFEAGEEINLERAEAARERAEGLLLRPGEETDLRRAEVALERAVARIAAKRGEGY